MLTGRRVLIGGIAALMAVTLVLMLGLLLTWRSEGVVQNHGPGVTVSSRPNSVAAGRDIADSKISILGVSPEEQRKLARKAQIDKLREFEAALGHQRTTAGTELDKIRALRQQLEQLPEGKIYLHAPLEMKVSDKRSVDARVGFNVTDDVLKSGARAGDQTAQGTLRVSHAMIATLNGAGFEIKPTTPEQQTVAEGFPTVWEWVIEAKQEGAQVLEAALYAVFPDVGLGQERQYIDSYTQKINVSVKEQTWSEWLKSAREEIDAVKAIAIALGGIATAVLGWLGISASRRTRSRTRPRKTRAAKSA